MEDVVIVGAGIAGSATAVGLKRVGIRALVLERADKLRVSGAILTLSSNAWTSLDALGLSHKLTSLYPPLSRGTIINVGNGEVSEITLPENARPVLLQTLAHELPPNSIRFSCNITSIQVQQQITVLHLEDGTSIHSKVLIGCDGVNSVVGRWLGLSEPIHSGRSAVLGLAHFSLDQEMTQFVDAGRRAAIVPLWNSENVHINRQP